MDALRRVLCGTAVPYLFLGSESFLFVSGKRYDRDIPKTHARGKVRVQGMDYWGEQAARSRQQGRQAISSKGGK